MIIFKKYTYRWWELGMFKASLLFLGIAIGAYWEKAFLPYIAILVAAGVVLGVYVAYVSIKQE